MMRSRKGLALSGVFSALGFGLLAVGIRVSSYAVAIVGVVLALVGLLIGILSTPAFRRRPERF